MNTEFLAGMKELLGDEYPAYELSLQEKPKRGFRINSLKTSTEDFFSTVSISHVKSPFADNGYYTDAPSGIGVSPAYLSGTFYMQEPSASSAVTILDPHPGDLVLDLCAAPGSKSTQIAEKLKHQGLLVANEYNRKRASILLENIERNGTANCIVTNSDTKSVASVFPEFFDKVLVDAPCSGEGMMRKETEAVRQWSKELVHHCASLQKEILDDAYKCLKPSGILVYSTCTLNMEENEEQILSFIERHPDMHICDTEAAFGRKAFINTNNIDKCIRIFPMDGGEGHFVAKLQKEGNSVPSEHKTLKPYQPDNQIRKFLDEQLIRSYEYYYINNDRLYAGTYPFIDTGKIHVLRNQVLLGEFLKNRFEPSHHFYLSAYTGFRKTYEMSDDEAARYLHGEEITASLEKGWYAVSRNGYVLGGAKYDGRVLKNKYPKGLRLR